MLASGGADATVRLWNLRTWACERVLTGHVGSVGALVARHDGSLVSGSADQTIRFWL